MIIFYIINPPDNFRLKQEQATIKSTHDSSKNELLSKIDSLKSEKEKL